MMGHEVGGDLRDIPFARFAGDLRFAITRLWIDLCLQRII